MIPKQRVAVGLSGRSKTYYIKRGYPFHDERRGARVVVSVEDLPPGSGAKVHYKCDACGKDGTPVYFALVGKKKHVCRACAQVGKAPGNTIDFSPRQRKEIVRLWSEELWIADEIGEEFGCTRVPVYRVLKDAGVDTSRRRKKPPNTVCDSCGKTFRRTPGELKSKNYCSKRCSSAAQTRAVGVDCQSCGRVFQIKPHQKAQRRFCSLDCHYSHAARGHWISCETCEERVWSTPARPRLFCSKKCFGLAQEKQIAMPCAHCGNSTLKPPAHLRYSLYFCSTECAREHRRSNASYMRQIGRSISRSVRAFWENGGPEVEKRRAQLSRGAAERMLTRANGSTSLERRVAAMLKELGIGFTPQKTVASSTFGVTKVFDFYLEAADAYLETHGTFWHADPRFYARDQPRSLVQIENVENDALKARIVLEELGRPLYVLWEHDVLEDPAKVRAQLAVWAQKGR